MQANKFTPPDNVLIENEDAEKKYNFSISKSPLKMGLLPGRREVLDKAFCFTFATE